MNLRQLEIFVAVAELGSFSQAANLLGTVQSALSRQVRALEVELRTTLLERNGRGVSLTDAGTRLLEHSRRILGAVEHTRADLQAHHHEPAGHIVVGMPPSVAKRITLPLIEHFRSTLPKARLEVVEGFSAHMQEWLLTGRVDLCLLYNPQPHANIETTPLLRERLCLTGLAGTVPEQGVRFTALPGYPLVMPQRGHIFRKLMEAQALLKGVRFNVAWEVSSVPVILDMLLNGYGYAALTESALPSHADAGRLAACPILEPEIHLMLCLAQRAHQRDTALMQHVRELIPGLCRMPAPGAQSSSMP